MTKRTTKRKSPARKPKAGLIRGRLSLNKFLGGLIAAVVAVVGIYVVAFSHAATPVYNVSGMTWASGCWPAGSAAEIDTFQNYRGTPCDFYHQYTTRNSGWGDLDSPWFLTNYPANYKGELLISTVAFPDNAVDYGGCAAGSYNSHYSTLATNLKTVQGGRWAAAVVRLNWEFNGDFMPWHATNAAQYIGCFDQFYKTVKAVDPSLRIDWTFNGHGTDGDNCGGNAFNCYPGDSFVDIVGIDDYDHYPPSLNQSAWDSACNLREGLCTLETFARTHHKQLSVGEWGLDRHAGTGGGDNPFYIQKMFDNFNANKDILAYEAYFNQTNTSDTGGAFSLNPNSGTLYKQLWGPNGPARGASALGVAVGGGGTSTPAPAQVSQTGNLAAGKVFKSSAADSTDTPGNPAGNVNDKNEATRWISTPTDDTTLATDLGASYSISRVSILWAGDTVKDYSLQTSQDNANWTTAANGATNNTTPQLINTTLNATGRYFRILTKDRWNAAYGNSIWELGIYGTAAPVATATPVPTAAPVKTSTPTPTLKPAATPTPPPVVVIPSTPSKPQPTGSTNPIVVTGTGGVAVSVPSGSTVKASGQVMLTNPTTDPAKTTVSVDNVTVASGDGTDSVSLDTSFLPNGDHQVVVQTTNSDGTTTTTGRNVVVNNPLNPFQQVRNYLYLHVLASKTGSSILSGLVVLIVFGALALGAWRFKVYLRRQRIISM